MRHRISGDNYTGPIEVSPCLHHAGNAGEMQVLQIMKFLEGATRTRLLHHELRGIGVMRAEKRHPAGSVGNELTSCKHMINGQNQKEE